MKVGEIPEYLKTVPPHRSVLMLGPPGIGKSTQIREFAEWEARQLGLEFIDYDYTHFKDVMEEPERYYVFYDLRLSECEPTDIGGVPRKIGEGAIANVCYDWAIVLSKVKRGLLLLDELNLIQRDDTEAQAYKLVLDRKAGSVRFSSGVRIVALGNTKETNPLVRFLSSGMRNRFNIVKIDCPAIPGWAKWMDEHVPEWDRRGLAYLMHFKEDFLKPPSAEMDGEDNWPSPRTWSWLLEELPKTPEKFWLEKAVGYLGPEVGHKFVSFLKNPVPKPEELLRKPEIFQSLSIDSKYLAVVMVANHYVGDERDRVKVRDVMRFLRAVVEEGGEFLSLFIMTAARRKDKALKLLQISATKEEYADIRRAFSELGWYL